MPRPIPDFEGFVGQRSRVRYIQKLIAGFHKTGIPIPPLLLVGPTGYGKTALVEATGIAAGTTLHKIFACSKTRQEHIHEVLRKSEHGDIVFVDEAHSLGRDAQQSLYTALDKRMLPGTGEKGRANGESESIAEFTLALATNYPGQILKALRSRAVQLTFEPYSQTELRDIARRVASTQNVSLTGQAASKIAETAQGTPRHVKKRLDILALYAPHTSEYTLDMVNACLKDEGIDEHGLTPDQRSFLRTLRASNSQSCAIHHLAARLGIDTRFIREETEPYLIECNYVEVLSNNTRRLTAAGHEVVAKLES